MKQINIINISLKQFDISKQNGKINIRLSYSLLDSDLKEYDTKTDSIKDKDLTTQQKTIINNIISALETKIKQKEKI